MSSALKQRTSFSEIQSRILTSVVVIFFLLTSALIFLYAKTEINARFDAVESDFNGRILSIDSALKELETHVSLMKHMADRVEMVPFNRQTGENTLPAAPPHHSATPDTYSEEYAMASGLVDMHRAVHQSGSSIFRSYYYSKHHDFFVSYPEAPHESGISPHPDSVLNPQPRLITNPFWSEPFTDRHTNTPMVTHATPLHQGGRLKGLIGADIPVEAFESFTTPVFGHRGIMYLVSGKGAVIASSAKKHPPEADSLTYNAVEPLLKQSETPEPGSRGFVFRGGTLILSGNLGTARWHLVYAIRVNDFLSYILPKMYIHLLSIFAAILTFALFCIILVYRYIKPSRLAETTLRKAHDELEVRVAERTAELSRINNELKVSNEKYKELFTHAPAGIYEIDFLKGKMVSVNDVMCDYTGYSREELLSLNPFSLLTKHGRKILTERLIMVHNGEEISRNVELDIIVKDGSRFSAFLNNNFVYKDGQITGSRVVVHDITEQKIAEKALKKSEERFRNLVESTSDWIWEVDREGRFTYNSPNALEITGYTPLELKGTRFLQYFSKGEHKKILSVFHINIDPTDPLASVECELIHKNGNTVIIESRGGHFFDEFGNIIGARGISRDITQKKKNAEEKAEFQKVLDRAKKMEALGLLAGGVAHDLNNILSGIINYPQLILLDLPDDSDLREHVNAIYLSGKRAAAIVDDLITVARGAARTKEVVNINTIINEYLLSAEYSSLLSHYPTVSINISMDHELTNISGSPVQIRKALLNLVINAFEAVRDNGIVYVSTQNRTVSHTIKGYDDIRPGDYVVLSVSDTGGGISPADMDRIFEPFYTKKVMGRSGTGLGLAIVWNTVTDHEGQLNVTSDTNGTVFELYFPATNTIELFDEPVKGLDAYRGKGEKILVVDDENIQREITCRLLNTLLYSSISTDSGENALELLKNEPADLVILDMIMDPGMNGRETYEKIIELYPDQKVIIATGYADTAEVKKAQEQGAGELLKKPFTIEELGAVVKRQMSA